MTLRTKLAVAALAAFASFPQDAPPADALALARAQFKAGSWQLVVDTLQEHLRFEIADADTDDLLGQALLKLGRRDEAAHHFDRALSGLAADDKRVGPLRKRIGDADPLTPRRDALFKKISRDLFAAASALEAGGNRERALDVLERIRRVATGAERDQIADLAAKIRSTTETVDLDKAAGSRPDDGWPELTHESKRYIFQAHLEPEVAELLGRTMDEIFEYYVKIYFDGDAKKVDARKAKIFIHASHAKLMELWQGPKDFVPGGWWSPGEWVVHAYDTRPDQGSLDEMLVTLFHEASHHFMTMLAGGGGTPQWLNEGTASFFEGASAMADGTVLWPDAARDRLSNLYDMLGGRGAESGRLPTMVGVIRSANGYPGEHYAWGWGLVYYLQQYEDPTTLEHVYRPLYVAYRDEAIKKNPDPLPLFVSTFIGDKSPRKHATIDEFERDWRAWIRDTIYPLYFGGERRELRMAAAERYLAAAKAAAGNKKAKVSEAELLDRALGQLDFVRTKIDKPETPDPAVLLKQADILEKLGRGGAAAPLLEQLIEMAAEGAWKADEAKLGEIEKRLSKLDAKNSPLRVAQSRAKNLARSATQLLGEYEKSGLRLRSYTFASLTTTALDDKLALNESAQRLRGIAREAGLLRGAMYKLAGASGTWKTIYNSEETAFEHSERRVAIESVRPAGRLCTAVPITGEYEIRAKLTRVGEPKIASTHGLIVSGTPTNDWLIVYLDYGGRVKLKRLNYGIGFVSDTDVGYHQLKNPPPVDKPFELVAHVLPDGEIQVTVAGEGPYFFKSPLALPAVSHAGVYVKYGKNVVDDALVELLP